MSDDRYALPAILARNRTRVVFAAGSLSRLGELAKVEGASRVLLVSDPGIVAAGHVDRALQSLRGAGLFVNLFDHVEENPSSNHVAAGVEVARQHQVDFLVGLGGGSAMDCAKGINFVFTNGGSMADYWGINKAAKPMLPMIAIPTTAGTGSDAQSFALIRDPITHRKMACGDVKAACRVAILDPDLTRTQPPRVAAAAAVDAVSHAVETAGSTKRNDISLSFTREAWSRLQRSFARSLQDPSDEDARADMLLGAHLAGAAIEHSMLGAAHACANPLTRRFGITHGVAVGLMLPHVIRFNTADGKNPYADLASHPAELSQWVETALGIARCPRSLHEVNVDHDALAELAEEAAGQWTATFNPRPAGTKEMLMLYQSAWLNDQSTGQAIL